MVGGAGEREGWGRGGAGVGEGSFRARVYVLKQVFVFENAIMDGCVFL